MELKVFKDSNCIKIEMADGSRLVQGWIDNDNLRTGKWVPPQVTFANMGAASPEVTMERAKLIAQVALRTQQEYLKIPKKERL